MSDDQHFFGGNHTETKLACLRKYLSAFSIALNNQGFARMYIDAFAGTGSREESHAALPILGHSDSETVTTEGSAAIALSIEPQFHHVVLIENDLRKLPALKKQISLSPNKNASVRHGDANEIVRHICRKTHWRGRETIGKGIRGVIFLDPYGMEVEWSTVEAIAATEALDCWYFFPLAGLYRNAPHDPLKIDSSKEAALNRVLGTNDWRQAWYGEKTAQMSLLDDLVPGERRIVDVDAIENYVKARLSNAFKGAVLEPLRLYNTSGAPLASLFFAVSNESPAAVRLASDIANHILNRGKSSQTRSR